MNCDPSICLSYNDIVFLNDNETKIQNYNIILQSQLCHSIITDNLLNHNDNYFYFIVVYCKNPGTPLDFYTVIRRKLVKCPKNPTKLINDCIITDLYQESNIHGLWNNKGPLHTKDKLLISNSLGQVFIGIADSTNLDPKCSNSMKYMKPSNTGSGSNSLNEVFPCDGTNPSDSYSRFLLAMKNDTIINIGLECSEDDVACFNSYFTIYCVSAYPFQYNFNRKKILISPSKVKFSDAILSLD